MKKMYYPFLVYYTDILYQRRKRMGSIKVERIDHLGIVAGVIQDLGIIEMIDSRIAPDEREEITTGQAIAE
ncbi:DUF4277 domain-containing protein [Candidatus Poribacteria bacterium]|nr:DUF4277 domain-containing protein [Candidatus Poribacteria bacterium]